MNGNYAVISFMIETSLQRVYLCLHTFWSSCSDMLPPHFTNHLFPVFERRLALGHKNERMWRLHAIGMSMICPSISGDSDVYQLIWSTRENTLVACSLPMWLFSDRKSKRWFLKSSRVWRRPFLIRAPQVVTRSGCSLNAVCSWWNTVGNELVICQCTWLMMTNHIDALNGVVLIKYIRSSLVKPVSMKLLHCILVTSLLGRAYFQLRDLWALQF